MKTVALLISPLAQSAYFKDTDDVASAEFTAVCGPVEHSFKMVGNLRFLIVEMSDDLLASAYELSFVQGAFQVSDEYLTPIDKQAHFNLHADFVFGSKYKGKTNEHLTQMLINVGLAHLPSDRNSPTRRNSLKLLDPMCGRGTTLLWAMRYGLTAKGIEQDAKAIDDIRQSIKKWTKLHRQKHKLLDGFIGKANKKGLGRFLDFSADDVSLRIIQGDTRQAASIIKKETFDLMVSDLPYGVQHFTTDNTRNPIAVLRESISDWKQLLKKDGVIVLAFNSYIPKRAELIECFEQGGLSAQPFSAPHRMSESIVRDVVVFKHA